MGKPEVTGPRDRVKWRELGVTGAVWCIHCDGERTSYWAPVGRWCHSSNASTLYECPLCNAVFTLAEMQPPDNKSLMSLWPGSDFARRGGWS